MGSWRESDTVQFSKTCFMIPQSLAVKHKGFTTASSKYADQINCTAIYSTTDVGR